MRKKIRNFIEKREFLRYFLTFLSGTLIAQFINIGISPFLTRFYSPSEMGLFGTYLAAVSLLGVFVTGRYQYAINAAGDEADAQSLKQIVNIFTICSCIVISIILIFFQDVIVTLFNISTNRYFLLWIPVTLLVFGLYQGSLYYLNRQKKFNILSNAKVIQSMTNGGIAVSLGWLTNNAIGLVVGNVMGYLFSFIYQKRKTKTPKVRLDLSRIKKNSWLYKHYPLYNAPSAFMDSLAVQAPVFIFLRFFSEVVVGFYSLTVRVFGLPLSIISTSLSQVFLSKISEMHRENRSYKKVVYKTAAVLLLIAIIPFSIVALFGPQLFSIIFGAQWEAAGQFARLLSIGYFFKFIVSPLSIVFFINGKVKLLSIIQLARAFTTVTVLILFSKFVEIEMVLLIYSLHEAIFYIIYFYFIVRTSK